MRLGFHRLGLFVGAISASGALYRVSRAVPWETTWYVEGRFRVAMLGLVFLPLIVGLLAYGMVVGLGWVARGFVERGP